MSSRGVVRLALTAIALAACATVAQAQAPAIRGIVRDSATREPIAGVVITLLDAAGQPSTHTIAGADGRFRMARTAAAVRIRARRIGFRPREIAIPPGASGDTATFEIDMGRIPQMLASVRVTGSSHCPGSTDNGEAAQLWAQARDGLLASIIARDAMSARTELVTVARTLEPRDERVVRHRHQTSVGLATRAFRATASAATFADRGYVYSDASDRIFNAPDADVLLDESFAATHCFRLVPGSGARADQIGLAFAPAQNRRGIVDVDGVLWLDRARPALHTLEFRYTQLDRVSTNARAGGIIEFETMSNGVVMISRWSLRMPVPASRSRQGLPGSVTARSRVTLAAIYESAGLVVAATWPDGVRWTQSVTGIAGTVVERGSGRPMTHALVTFAGAADTVATDSTGRFALMTVLPGLHEVSAMDSSLGSYVEARRVRRIIDVPENGTAGIVLELPSQDESIRRLCADERMRPHASLLLGRLQRADGGAPDRLEVLVSWQDDIAVRGGGVAVREAQRTIDPDSNGRFHVCGVVRERPVKIVVRLGETTVADTAVFVYDSIVQRVELIIPSSNEPGAERANEPGAERANEPGAERANAPMRIDQRRALKSGLRARSEDQAEARHRTLGLRKFR